MMGVWRQKAQRGVKEAESMWGADMTETLGVSVAKATDMRVGYGRTNPNATRGRERRGQKKSKRSGQTKR